MTSKFCLSIHSCICSSSKKKGFRENPSLFSMLREAALKTRVDAIEKMRIRVSEQADVMMPVRDCPLLAAFLLIRPRINPPIAQRAAGPPPGR